MAGLEIQIGADSSDLQKKIKEAEFNLKELSKVKIEQIKLGLDTKEINGNIASVKKSLNDLKTASKDSGNAIAGMTPQVANGGNALMQFSRIAQDAPYGIIGIGNNLTATAEAFGYLKQQTGSTGGALKALAGSIMGTGGILLAVSLVTTAFTYMAQNGLTVGDVYDKLTGKFDNAKKALTDLAVEAAKTAGTEISSLKSLVSVAQNDTKSREDRLIAVRKLQDMYPAYFGNLSTETILNSNLTGVVNQLSGALKERARAAALSGKAGELASKELGIQEKLRDTYQEVFKLLGAKTSAEQLKIISKLNSGNLELSRKQLDMLGTIDGFKMWSLKRSYSDLRSELVGINSELNKIQKLSDASVGKGIKSDTKYISKEKNKATSKKVDGVNKVKELESFISPIEIDKGKIISPDIKIDEVAKNANDELLAGLAMQQRTLDEFNDGLNNTISQGTVSALSGIGEAIGGALASGGNVIDAVGKSILGSMGSMLQELGKATIAYGVGLTAIKLAKKNPAAAIAAGVAMVALGSMISKSVAKSSSVVGGGGSVDTGASVSSPTSSTGSGGSSSFTGGTVVFEISGQSLIGVLSNTLDKNRRLGGSLSF